MVGGRLHRDDHPRSRLSVCRRQRPRPERARLSARMKPGSPRARPGRRLRLLGRSGHRRAHHGTRVAVRRRGQRSGELDRVQPRRIGARGGLAWRASWRTVLGSLSPTIGSPIGGIDLATAAFTPGGHLLGASADGGAVVSVNPISFALRLQAHRSSQIHHLGFTPTSKAFSPNGQLLAAAIGHGGAGSSGVGLASIAPAAVGTIGHGVRPEGTRSRNRSP